MVYYARDKVLGKVFRNGQDTMSVGPLPGFGMPNFGGSPPPCNESDYWRRQNEMRNRNR